MGYATTAGPEPAGRGACPLAFPGIRAETLAGLTEALGPEAPPAEWLVADLSLGAWRGHHLARELADQLGIRLAAAGGGVMLPGASGGELSPEIVGSWIDAEGRGDPAARAALRHARRLASALQDAGARMVLIAAPRFGIPWDAESRLLLSFLAPALAGAVSVCLLDAGGATPPPDGWAVGWREAGTGAASPAGDDPMALVPGTIDARLVTAMVVLGRSIALPGVRVRGRQLLVAPELRRAPDRVPAEAWPTLARLTAGTWIEAYAAHQGRLDPERQRAAGWHAFAGGSPDLALRYLAGAAAAAPAGRAVYQTHLQTVRIAAQRYAEAADEPDPPPDTPPPLAGVLARAKAWGSIMAGRPREAIERFGVPGEWARDPAIGPWLGLYLKNIYALTRFRLGDHEAALALERDIERELDAMPEPWWHLRYLNWINLARLSRAAGDYAAAERRYHQAFGMMEGVRLSSDVLYAHVCLAALDEARGRPRAALAAWLRAGLVWAGLPAPEALGWRVHAAIIGRRLDDPLALPEAVSRALHERLGAAARAAGVAAEPGAGAPPVFAFPEDVPGVAWPRLVGAPGWCLLIGDAERPAAYDGPWHRRLRQLLIALLAALGPVPDADRVGLLGVDLRRGRDVAGTPADVLAVAVARGAHDVAFGGRSLRLPATLRAELAARASLALAPAVASVQERAPGAIVRYTRYRAPTRLSPAAAAVVAQVRRAGSVAAGALGDRRPVAGLERHRVLVRDLAASVAVDVGLVDEAVEAEVAGG